MGFRDSVGDALPCYSATASHPYQLDAQAVLRGHQSDAAAGTVVPME